MRHQYKKKKRDRQIILLEELFAWPLLFVISKGILNRTKFKIDDKKDITSKLSQII